MSARFYVEDDFAISLAEEPEFFRMKFLTSEVQERHVEEFMDTTVEWLSTNPTKGILIDFKGVKSVCSQFAALLHHHYEDIKRRGLYVRFVNVDPTIESHLDVSNITVVLHRPLYRHRAVVSAKQILEDLANDVSDMDLMEKYGLSERGLAKMFKKLLAAGLISKSKLAQRMGVETDELSFDVKELAGNKPVINASEVLEDIANDKTNGELMRKYKLSEKGLRSILKKLYDRGLISKIMLKRRKNLKG